MAVSSPGNWHTVYSDTISPVSVLMIRTHQCVPSTIDEVACVRIGVLPSSGTARSRDARSQTNGSPSPKGSDRPGSAGALM